MTPEESIDRLLKRKPTGRVCWARWMPLIHRGVQAGYKPTHVYRQLVADGCNPPGDEKKCRQAYGQWAKRRKQS